MSSHVAGIWARAKSFAESDEPLFSVTLHVMELVSHVVNGPNASVFEKVYSVSPGFVDKEPGPGCKAHSMKRDVQVELASCFPPIVDRTVFGAGAFVPCGFRKTEFDIVSREFPRDMPEVAE